MGYEMLELNEIMKEKKRKGELIEMERCRHSNVVKEYYKGVLSDYTCMDCGMQSLNKKDFQ